MSHDDNNNDDAISEEEVAIDKDYVSLTHDEKQGTTYRQVLPITTAKIMRLLGRPVGREALALSVTNTEIPMSASIYLRYENQINMLTCDNPAIQKSKINLRMITDYFTMMMSKEGFRGEQMANILRAAVTGDENADAGEMTMPQETAPKGRSFLGLKGRK